MLDAGTAATLAEASRLWRRVQAVMRLELTDMEDEAAWPQAVKDTLVRAAGCQDFAALTTHAAQTAAAVMAAFDEIIDQPAAALAAARK